MITKDGEPVDVRAWRVAEVEAKDMFESQRGKKRWMGDVDARDFGYRWDHPVDTAIAFLTSESPDTPVVRRASEDALVKGRLGFIIQRNAYTAAINQEVQRRGEIVSKSTVGGGVDGGLKGEINTKKGAIGWVLEKLTGAEVEGKLGAKGGLSISRDNIEKFETNLIRTAVARAQAKALKAATIDGKVDPEVFRELYWRNLKKVYDEAQRLNTLTSPFEYGASGIIGEVLFEVSRFVDKHKDKKLTLKDVAQFLGKLADAATNEVFAPAGKAVGEKAAEVAEPVAKHLLNPGGARIASLLNDPVPGTGRKVDKDDKPFNLSLKPDGVENRKEEIAPGIGMEAVSSDSGLNTSDSGLLDISSPDSSTDFLLNYPFLGRGERIAGDQSGDRSPFDLVVKDQHGAPVTIHLDRLDRQDMMGSQTVTTGLINLQGSRFDKTYGILKSLDPEAAEKLKKLHDRGYEQIKISVGSDKNGNFTGIRIEDGKSAKSAGKTDSGSGNSRNVMQKKKSDEIPIWKIAEEIIFTTHILSSSDRKRMEILQGISPDSERPGPLVDLVASELDRKLTDVWELYQEQLKGEKDAPVVDKMKALVGAVLASGVAPEQQYKALKAIQNYLTEENK